MIPFLKSVARAYADQNIDLSEYCFLFPNKRSGTFFLKYLAEETEGRPVIAPAVKAINDFVAEVAGTVVASRLDMLFMLYASYRKMQGTDIEDPEGVDFDQYRIWGETVIQDYNEVDKYLADPDEVFKNIKDYREISANYLTEEQRRVAEEYFGYTYPFDSGRMWRNFDDEGEMSESKMKYLQLWRVMGPLYHLFKADLKSKGLSTPGGVYRDALEVLKSKGRGVLPFKKIVAVGFNALSTAEQAVFATLRDLEPSEGHTSFADFFWDATGPVLTQEGNSASRFVKSNIRRFPCPDWALPYLQLSDTETLPADMTVCKSPSNAVQTKIAGKLLADMQGTLKADRFDKAKVAVVLADENLLLPMLYSLPRSIESVNLTMGYSLRLTSVVPFVTHLRRLFGNMRIAHNQKQFYHRDLRQLLSHQFTHSLLGTRNINRLTGWLDLFHRQMVSVEEIAQYTPVLADMLSKLNLRMDPAAVTGWLDDFLVAVATALEGRNDGLVKSKLESAHIQVYRDALRRLTDLFGEYPVSVAPTTVFRLIDRLLAQEKVGFEGEPLSGLQIMGTLETRSLDFEHLIIVSANEKILPMRARTRTFIPDSMRHAYAMPPSNYAEEIFAYYFYRMISRAKTVSMIYDSRTGSGVRASGESRYLLQLKYMYAKEALKTVDWKFVLSGREDYDPSIAKTDEIKAKLKEYEDPDSHRNLSPSAIQNYISCQVKFFFKNVAGIDDENKDSEYITPIELGNILHQTMLELYLPADKRGIMLETPVMLRKEYIKEIQSDRKRIESTVRRAVNRLHYKLGEDELDRPLEGEPALIAGRIVTFVNRILTYDISQAPIRIYGVEIAERLRVGLDSGRTVNFKFAIDRLDDTGTDSEPKLRIVDYKTGGVRLKAENKNQILEDYYNGKNIFQLFCYAWLLNKRGATFPVNKVDTEIYGVLEMKPGTVQRPRIADALAKEMGKKGHGRVLPYPEVADEFDKGLQAIIEDIFTSDTFKATDNKKNCEYCAFKTLCRRF